MRARAAARRDGRGGRIVCLAPDVCLTPVGNAIVPIPYMIVSELARARRTARSVHITGQEAFTMDSRTDGVVGNEPGTSGGVASGVNRGWCRPITMHATVHVEGAELVLSDNLYDMNCAGPEGSGNTVGRLIFVE